MKSPEPSTSNRSAAAFEIPVTFVNGHEPTDGTPGGNGYPIQRPRFRSEALPSDYLEAILRLSSQALTAFCPQAWGFIVIRDECTRERLDSAGAPLVLMTFTLPRPTPSGPPPVTPINGADHEGPRERARYSRDGSYSDFARAALVSSEAVRRKRTALATLRLVAQAYDVCALPLHRFDQDLLKRQFCLPHEAEIVALLGLGFTEEPSDPSPARDAVSLREFVHVERYGQHWLGTGE